MQETLASQKSLDHLDFDNVVIKVRTMPLGDLQQLSMLAVARLAGNAYGAAIREELRRVAGRDVSVQTVWVTLVRLEEQGLTDSVEVPRPGGGRARRVFRLTPSGWQALQDARASMGRMWEGVVVP